ncbi:putative isochorismatase family hydrolase [Aspergillus taichungensis]|uniref:Putative isochorismatase family hydrolase n=1 Tax=Aspergillus taichungensis TaxID=482145 RepID=A0A2J5HDI9_9EURO|nr:putative isochorismatase family hydrolase [Aspergillus taichungensis]
MSLDISIPTALILIDNQAAFTHPTYWGSARSNPSYENNLQALLSAFRAAKRRSPSTPLEIIHVFHSSSTDEESPLHPAHPGEGIHPLEFAAPATDGSELVTWKSVSSGFIGTELAAHVREKGIRQLVFAGLTTDHCVSTTVRMAANLGVVSRGSEDPGRIVLVADATATWAKGGFDAETVHAVSVASLKGEFADVLSTEEVVKSLLGGT